MKDNTFTHMSYSSKNSRSISFDTKNTVFLFLLFFIFLIMLLPMSGLANPIPVYPETTPSFQPASAITDVQQPGFALWLVLVTLLDFAANMLFLYLGLFLLVLFKMEKESWFSTISRRKLVSSVVVLSFFGILSEWLLGSSIGSLLVIAAIVFIVTFLVGFKWFDLRVSASSFLAGYMVFANVISWAIIFLLL
jgi:hypothetical protein